jgi:hypothetical protein
MDVSPNALRKETVELLGTINKQMDEVTNLAQHREIRPTELMDQRGAFLMSPLLIAKSQCLATLTMLNEQGHGKRGRR